MLSSVGLLLLFLSLIKLSYASLLLDSLAEVTKDLDNTKLDSETSCTAPSSRPPSPKKVKKSYDHHRPDEISKALEGSIPPSAALELIKEYDGQVKVIHDHYNEFTFDDLVRKVPYTAPGSWGWRPHPETWIDPLTGREFGSGTWTDSNTGWKWLMHTSGMREKVFLDDNEVFTLDMITLDHQRRLRKVLLGAEFLADHEESDKVSKSRKVFANEDKVFTSVNDYSGPSKQTEESADETESDSTMRKVYESFYGPK
jgi:hypothetical protein